ncbi:MAG: ABC transporter substrate-binding protein [Actinomycetota bacterium]
MVPRGGTLRVVTTGFWPDTLDPKEFDGQTWEILRCCLLRTLLSYNGRPTDRGGTLLRPDLATGLPDVSPDGLTWTFHLKEGIRYAPPLQNTEIVAQDFERALLRAADPRANPSAYYGTYSFYYSVIQGFDAVARGRSQTISGLSTPDDHTLVVRLKAPTGDLGYRFAFPAVAPIPANPTDPSARLGVAQGHDDGYTQFLVSSGPYMVDGAAKLDFTQAAASQAPVVGLDLGRETPEALIPGSLTLVRDPSWVASSDDLRPAYPDRIEIQLGPAKLGPHPPPYPRIVARLFREVGDGRWDVVLGTDPPLGIVDRAASDPAIASRLHTEQVAIPDFIAMNLAVPPFDDVHVRRAFSLALDKAALVSRANKLRDVSPSFRGVAARHLAPDALEGGLLSSWRPSWDVAPDGGDIAAAEAEMRRSRYDVDGDGLCDGAACDHAAFVVDDAYPATLLSPMRDALEAIGIRFNLRRVPRSGGGRGPADHVAVTADRWFNDFPAGSAFFPENFSGRAFTSPTNVDWDPSLLGASTEQLRAWGYAVSQVPAVDTSIDRCDALAGQQQVQCWASLDQHLMENVVPWIPFMFQTSTAMVSSRVVQYSFDQSTEQPALDQLAVGSG